MGDVRRNTKAADSSFRVTTDSFFDEVAQRFEPTFEQDLTDTVDRRRRRGLVVVRVESDEAPIVALAKKRERASKPEGSPHLVAAEA